MQELAEKQDLYYSEAYNAIITEHIMIKEIKGRQINLNKSYQKMKSLNKFSESLLVFDTIIPTKTINNHFDKIIIPNKKDNKNVYLIINIKNEYFLKNINDILKNNSLKVDILIDKDYDITNMSFQNKVTYNYLYFTNYCITTSITINENCIKNNKYTFLVHPINNSYLINTQEILSNGTILLYTFNENNLLELNLIIKFLKNNNYTINTLDKLINN